MLPQLNKVFVDYIMSFIYAICADGKGCSEEMKVESIRQDFHSKGFSEHDVPKKLSFPS